MHNVAINIPNILGKLNFSPNAYKKINELKIDENIVIKLIRAWLIPAILANLYEKVKQIVDVELGIHEKIKGIRFPHLY